MKPGPPADDFYARLPSFREFRDFTDDRHFVPVPDGWSVVLTDISGSTAAIAAGAYREVNTLGAAAIAVVQELLGRDFPYVFGGDGASLLVWDAEAAAVLELLARLRRLARGQFGLELRVGRVPVAELRRDGHVIEVARHELAAGRCVAVFRGGGLAEAERRIKAAAPVPDPAEAGRSDLPLGGLSCRWQPLPSRHGRMLSLLIRARVVPAAGVYQDFLTFLEGVFGGRLDEANPVNPGLMRYRPAAECVRDERRLLGGRARWRWPARLGEILAAGLVFGRGFRLPFLAAGRYRDSMRLHADHRKFDDVLRMVLDCSPAQVAAIRARLEQARGEGALHYGLHESDTALMTCYVQSLRDGGHIHFIDGGDGGYALAARELKRQAQDAAG